MLIAQAPCNISLNQYLYSISPSKEGFSLAPSPKPFPADLTLSLLGEDQFRNFDEKKQSLYIRISSLFHINKKYLLKKCKLKGLNLINQRNVDSTTVIDLINQLFDVSRARVFLETLAFYEKYKEVEELLPDQIELIEFANKFSYGGPYKAYSEPHTSRCSMQASELADGGWKAKDKIMVISKQRFNTIFRPQNLEEQKDSREYRALIINVNSSGHLSVDGNYNYHIYNKELVNQELKIRDKCKHPSILPYPEYFIVGNDPQSPTRDIGVLKMKHQLTLKDEMFKRKKMSSDFILQTLGEAAGAIASLHNEGIFHRDIRPVNFVYEKNRLKLANFQFSTSEASWDKNSLIGNIRFLSPEACLDGENTEKMDIWAFGLVMYALLNPKHKFPGFVREFLPDAIKSYRSLKQKISPETMIPLELLFKNRPETKTETEEKLRSLIAACLSLNPDDRPSANDVLNVLIKLRIARIENCLLQNMNMPKVINRIILDYDKPPLVQKTIKNGQSHSVVPCYFVNPEDKLQSHNSSPVNDGVAQISHNSPVKFTGNPISFFPGRISPSLQNLFLGRDTAERILKPKPSKLAPHAR